MSAMSVSGSEPTRSARRLRPSIRRTMIRSASAITWWFVRMWPAASIRNPVPAPRRGPSRSVGDCCRSNSSGLSGSGVARRRGRATPGTVASMLTTAGLRRSATSAKDASAGMGVDASAARGATRRSGSEWAGAGVIVPATMSPIRNATVATRPMVTARNRRLMHPLYGGDPVYRNALTAFLRVYRNALTAFLRVYRNALTAFLRVYRNAFASLRRFGIADQLEKTCFLENRNAERFRLFCLRARIRPHNHRRCLPADRAGDLGAERFQRAFRLLTRHRQGAVDDVVLSVQWAGVGGRQACAV